MKNKLSNSLFLLFLFFATNVYSNSITEITFIGLNNTSKDKLLNELPVKAGDEYSDSASNAIIKSLFETGLFSDITVINNDGSLKITLLENPTIKFFDISLDTGRGFSNWIKGEKLLISTEVLDEEVENNGLSAGNPYTKDKLNEFTLLIESKYFSSGYYNAKIKPLISIDSQNRAGIELIINQGDRAKIESFSILGANNIAEDKLLKFFKIGEADMMLVNFFTIYTSVVL